MGDSSRSVTSICGPCEYITPIGVRVPHNPPDVGMFFGNTENSHHIPSFQNFTSHEVLINSGKLLINFEIKIAN